MNLIGIFKDKLLTEFQEPFSKDCITQINIEIGKNPSIFRGNKKCRATVKFKNGNSEGWQNIDDDDFQTLMLRVKTFCESI